MTTKQSFHEEVVAITKALRKKKQQIKDHEKAVQERKNKKFVSTEVPKLLPLIKERIREAAERGDCFIDRFPTGAVGNALLELLGAGFNADTDTQRYVGASDGQGWYEGPYIYYTRLIWKDQSTKLRSK